MHYCLDTIPMLAVVIVATILIFKSSRADLQFRNISWFDKRDEIFSVTRSKLRAFIHGRKIFSEAYNNLSKKGLVAVISTISKPLVLIPVDKRGWFFAQNKLTLDPRATGFDAVETHFTMPCGRILEHPSHTRVIKKDLTKQLGNLTDVLANEVENALEDLWGSDTEEWHEFVLWDSIIALVTRTFNRIAVDKPLCRDQGYLNNTKKYVNSLHAVSAIIRVLPWWSKPILGRLLAAPCWYYYWRGKRFLFLVISEWTSIGWTEFESGIKQKDHNVFLMWLIRNAIKERNCLDLEQNIIYGRLMTMNFAGIHTSTFTVVNALLDALSYGDVFNEINKEVVEVTHRHNKSWNKSAVDDLKFVDKAIRESIRCSGPIVRLLREVVPDGGIDVNGVNIPKGATVAVDMHNVHADSSIYINAENYNPNRPSPTGKKQMPSLVTTSEHFLGFGHGRTACPGRFFAADEMKIIISVISLRYHIKEFELRPANIWMGDSVVPQRWTKIRVKRKHST